jgi:glycosyltransferase involved in cell wall biosynthesis
MRVLALSSALPFPPIGGGKLRSYHLLKSLAARHRVTQVGFTFGPLGEPDFPMELIPVPWVEPPLYRQMHSADPAISQRAYDELAWRCPEPWLVSYYDSPAMSATVAAVAARGFDVILIEGTAMGRFLPDLPAATPKLLNLFDLHTRMARRAAHSPVEHHDADRVARFEAALARQCVACLVCSETEAAVTREQLNVGRVHVIPNGVDLARIQPVSGAEEPGRLLFVGMMNYEPNARAVAFFVREVLPRLRAEESCVRLHVVGADPPSAIRALAGADVIIHDFVSDLGSQFAAAEMMVVPLLSGGGTRLKILEAAAYAKPIVTTTLGAEGLDFVNGRDLVRADSAAEFADAIIALRRDPARRQALGQNARRAVAPYDWRLIGEQFCRVVADAAQIVS